jgi:hypothetical protein
MVTIKIHTETKQLKGAKFDDIEQAERYAMRILGTETSWGTICRVDVVDTMLGARSTFEF